MLLSFLQDHRLKSLPQDSLLHLFHSDFNVHPTQFGVRVPRNEAEARELDKIYQQKGLKLKWKLAEEAEVSSLNEYTTFKDNRKGRAPPGFRYIKVFFVYVVKHDLCHKARLVAGGHMTPDEGNS